MIITEQEMEFLCDELCRHPRECQEQQELDEICERCPFAEKQGGEGDEVAYNKKTSQPEKGGPNSEEIDEC